jgi:hypothetical protein
MPFSSPTFYFSFFRQKKILANQPQWNGVKSLRTSQASQSADSDLNKTEGKKFH